MFKRKIWRYKLRHNLFVTYRKPIMTSEKDTQAKWRKTKTNDNSANTKFTIAEMLLETQMLETQFFATQT